MDNYIKEEISYKGYNIKIESDNNPFNPRENDNIGTMICFHSRYNLGDYEEAKKYSGDEQFLASISGVDYDELFDEIAGNDYSYNDFDDVYPQVMKTLMEKAREKNIILPLYLYDHSGITMSTGRFSDRWDSGQVGWIYFPKDKMEAEQYTDDWLHKYYPDETKQEVIESILKAEVEEYDQFLTGDVWGYVVQDINGQDIESCWGYFGDEGAAYAMEEAKSIVDYLVNKKIKSHNNKLKEWIRNKVPVIYRQPLTI